MKSPTSFPRYGSGAGSRWTWATASSISRMASLRQTASCAASAHLFCSRNSSATFRQSRPSGEFFNSGINVIGVVMFAVAAEPEQFGDDQLRAVARARWRRRRRPFSGTRPDPCRPRNALRRRSRRLVRQIVAGELAVGRRGIGILIVGHDQDERQFFDGGLVERFVKRAGGSRAVAEAGRADGAGNAF